MIKVDEGRIELNGHWEQILSEYGILTTELLNYDKIPKDLKCKTIKLAFEIAGMNIMDLITTDLELTENLKAEIEQQRKQREEKGE